MNNYYIYVYLDVSKPGKYFYQDLEFEYEPFYIGKGNNYRATRHLTQCFNKNEKKGYRRLFYQKLRKLLNNNFKPLISFYSTNLDEQSSFKIETELIEKIGRRILKEGPLCNNSLGGEGPSGSRHSGFEVVAYDKSGIKCMEFKSVREASDITNIDINSIYRQCFSHKNSFLEFRFRRKDRNIEKLENVERFKNKKPRKIFQYDLIGNFIQEWKNINEVEKIKGFSKSLIQSSAGSKHTTYKNFIWLFDQNKIKQKIENLKIKHKNKN